MKIRAQPVFPTVLYGADVDLSGWRDRLLRDIAEWREAVPESFSRSERGGAWHSPLDAMRRPAFRPVVDAALELATAAFRTERYVGHSRARVDAMWANVLPAGAHHVPHSHMPSLWSGVFYTRVPAGSGRIVFVDPRPAAECVRPTLADGVPLTCGVHRVDATEGLLLLFPAWLQHYVEPHDGDADRVAISFNVRQVVRDRIAPLPPRSDGEPRWTVRPALLSADDRQRIIDLCRDGWRPAKIGNDRHDPNVRDSEVQWLHLDDPAWRWLGRVLGDEARAAARGDFGGVDVSGGARLAQVTRYGPGQHYGPHRDRGPAGRRRTLSCSVLLNDTVEGGLRFPDSGHEPPVQRPGDALFFRADERHEAVRVDQGERFTLVVWFDER